MAAQKDTDSHALSFPKSVSGSVVAASYLDCLHLTALLWPLDILEQKLACQLILGLQGYKIKVKVRDKGETK